MARFKLLVGPLCVALSVVILDRLTKAWALRTLAPAGSPGYDPLPGLLRLVYVENRGVAFGQFQNNSTLFGVLAVFIIGGIIWRSRRWFWQTSQAGRWSIAMIVAGGVGNIIDRLQHGFVVDFLHLIPLPIFQVFNIADASISLGAVLLFIILWREDARQRAEQTTSQVSNV